MCVCACTQSCMQASTAAHCLKIQNLEAVFLTSSNIVSTFKKLIDHSPCSLNQQFCAWGLCCCSFSLSPLSSPAVKGALPPTVAMKDPGTSCTFLV